RLGLPELLGSTPCLEGFSRRFLRESTIFPLRAPNGGYRLALADPSDTASIRAAELVFGAPVEVAVASFEDITTLLDQRADAAGADEDAKTASPQSDDDIESLRDLASGAPVVRALNDLLERAVELRASDIHIEPFRTGLVIRMRVDGLLRALPAPTGIPPQALISRVKILAGLNIAERPQRQDHDARHHAVDPQRADPKDPHHRGSRRIRNPGDQPVAGQTLDRAHLCLRNALLCPPGPRCDHGRRNPRRRDRAYRDPRRAH